MNACFCMWAEIRIAHDLTDSINAISLSHLTLVISFSIFKIIYLTFHYFFVIYYSTQLCISIMHNSLWPSFVMLFHYLPLVGPVVDLQRQLAEHSVSRQHALGPWCLGASLYMFILQQLRLLSHACTSQVSVQGMPNQIMLLCKKKKEKKKISPIIKKRFLKIILSTGLSF